MPILSLNELERVEAGPAHRAFGGLCGPGCRCRSCMGDITQDLTNGGLTPADISYVYSVCASDYIKANPNTTNAQLVAYCQSILPYGPGFQAKLASLNLGPAPAINNANITVKLQFTIGQLNLDIYGQILKNYSGLLNSDDRTLLNDAFTNWNQSLTQLQFGNLFQVFDKIVYGGGSISLSPATQKAIQDLSTAIPTVPFPDMAQAVSDPVTFYSNLLNSLHTVATTVPNTAANNYLPAQGAPVPTTTAIPNSQGLTATDWTGAAANQAVVTDLKNATYTSPLNTLYLPTTTQNAAATSAASVAPASTSQPNNVPLMIGAVLLGWVLLKGE